MNNARGRSIGGQSKLVCPRVDRPQFTSADSDNQNIVTRCFSSVVLQTVFLRIESMAIPPDAASICAEAQAASFKARADARSNGREGGDGYPVLSEA